LPSGVSSLSCWSYLPQWSPLQWCLWPLVHPFLHLLPSSKAPPALTDAPVGHRLLSSFEGYSPSALLPLLSLETTLNRRRCLTWISSSILSFSVWHSSVVSPMLLWYQHLQVQSMFLGLAALLDDGIRSTLKA